jgi:hypothetical protein
MVEQLTSWKMILEQIISIVVTSKVHALAYVVLRKAEKHRPWGN